MATIRLFLKNTKAKKTAVRAIISDGRKIQLKLYPGVSVNPKHWSKSKGYVLSADPDAISKNEFLTNFMAKALQVYLEAKITGQVINSDMIKKAVFRKEEDRKSLWSLLQHFVEYKFNSVQAASRKKYATLISHLESFQDIQKKELQVDDFNEALLEDFQNYCYSNRGLNTQTTYKYIGFLKTFLRWCFKRNYIKSNNFQQFKPIRQPDSTKIIIEKDEFTMLESLQLAEDSYLFNCRELLILSCLTGLRFSDYSRIKKHHLRQDDRKGFYSLAIRQQKTDEDLDIPLTERAYRIVQSLVNGKIHSISNQKMNKYAKEVCKLAGIDSIVEKYTYVGKQKKVDLKPKYELVTTHTGRRTFATNLLLAGHSAEEVMPFTGHKDYKSFSAYVNIPKNNRKEVIRSSLMGKSFMKVAG